MVWENVPGAFSSNKGKDFQAVLTEIVRIVEPDTDDVPMPEKGKWPKSGCLYDEMGRWSIAWRVHDAQFWGVPQRRKRIALVADFGGLSAPEVCFERKGMQWDPPKSGEKGERTSCGAEEGTDSAISFQERAGKPGGGKGILIQNERTGALSTFNNQSVFAAGVHENQKSDVKLLREVHPPLTTGGDKPRQSYPCAYISESEKRLNPLDIQMKMIQPADGVADALCSAEKRWGGSESYVFDASRRHDHQPFGEVCETVQAAYVTGENNQPTVVQSAEPILLGSTQDHAAVTQKGISTTLTANMGMGGGYVPMIIGNVDENSEVETAKTLDCFDPNPSKDQGGIAIVQPQTQTDGGIIIGDAGTERTGMYTPADCGCLTGDVADTPGARPYGTTQMAAAGFDGNQGSKARTIGYEPEMAGTLEAGKRKHVLVLNDQGGSVMDISQDKTATLRAQEHGHQPIVLHEPAIVEMTSTKNAVLENGICPTLTARMGTGGNQVNAVCVGSGETEKKNGSPMQGHGEYAEKDADSSALYLDVGFFTPGIEKATSLLARQYKDPPLVYEDKKESGESGRIQNVTGPLMASGYEKNGTQEAANGMYVVQECGGYKDSDAAGTKRSGESKTAANLVTGALCSDDYKGPNSQYVDQDKLQLTENTVRRLTPLECERLQGYPDGWTDIGDWKDSKGKIRKATDSARYKALGNSIALPFWFYLLRRISAQYERPATLGSLFDGISGFPLIWAKFNGPRCCIWTSEIEEFPIAVCKKHFGDEDTGEKGDLAEYLDRM